VSKRTSPIHSLSPFHACANCGVAEAADTAALKPCLRCKAVVYNGKEYQAQHWKKGGHFTPQRWHLCHMELY
jgi:hypothetical protein